MTRRGLMIGERVAAYEHPSRLLGEKSARREVSKLKSAIGRAVQRKDRKAVLYLERRLSAAQVAIAQRGWQDVDYE